MRNIHDEKVIKQRLSGKAAWLAPVDAVFGESYVGNTLVRIEDGFHNLVLGPCFNELQLLRELQHDFFGNKNGIGIWSRLKACLGALEKAVGHEIVWCLPFVDFDLFFSRHVPYLEELVRVNFPNLMVFLVYEQDMPTIFYRFERPNAVIALDREEMHDLIEDIRKTMPPPKLQQPFGEVPEPEEEKVRSFYEDEEEEKPKPPPKYRSLDDE